MGEKIRSITHRERQLLLYSEAVKECPPWFCELLKNNTMISSTLISSLTSARQRYIRNIYPQVFKLARQEWRRDRTRQVLDLGENKEEHDRCSLDNRRIRWVYHIVNTRNNRDLKIGRICYRNFVAKSPADADKLAKEASRVRALNEIDTIIPGIKRIIDSWYNELDKFPIAIPRKYKDPYDELGRRTEEIFEDILNNKRPLRELEDCLEQQTVLLKDIKQYVSQHKDDKFIATKNIVRWLRRRKTEEAAVALRDVNNTGKITPLSIHRIREENFMKSLIPELNLCLPENVTILTADVSKGGYIYRYVINSKTKEEMQLFCRHKDLLLEFGLRVLGEEANNSYFDFKKVYDCSTVLRGSYDYVIHKTEQLAETLRTLYDVEFNEILIERQKNQAKYYVIMELDKFIDMFKASWGLTKKQIGELISPIFQSHKIHSKLDLAKYETPSWLEWDRILPKDEARLMNLCEQDFELPFLR